MRDVCKRRLGSDNGCFLPCPSPRVRAGRAGVVPKAHSIPGIDLALSNRLAGAGGGLLLTGQCFLRGTWWRYATPKIVRPSDVVLPIIRLPSRQTGKCRRLRFKVLSLGHQRWRLRPSESPGQLRSASATVTGAWVPLVGPNPITLSVLAPQIAAYSSTGYGN